MHANKKVASMQMYTPTYFKSLCLSQVEPGLDRQEHMQILFMEVGSKHP